MEVDFGHEFGFCSVWWTLNERWVVIVGVVVTRDRVRLLKVRRRCIFCR
jgi:hypothetical protein